ncbi:MAG: ABC transporter permease [Acidobacteria bacterium]|nr:ABC transporter permease [Acidobacteriota bacterium]
MSNNHRSRHCVWGDGFLRDLRFGITSLGRDPAFAVLVIGLLALGIGASTAMFSVVNATLLKPPPFPEPERMVRVWEAPPHSGRNPTTTLTYLDWKEQRVLRASLAGVMPAWKEDWGFAVDPFAQGLVGDTPRRSISLAFGAVLAVMLIACANVANLLLARGASRRKEMALRAALGASRGRLVAQLLTECLVLCLLSGAAGVALANLLLQGTAPLLARSLPFTADVSLDPRVLAFAAAMAMAVVVVAGLLPSVQTSSVKLSEPLKQEARGLSASRASVRRTIVIGEVAVSVVLICGAALLFKSLARLGQVDAGVRIDRVLTMATDLPSSAYPDPQSAARFYEALVQRLRAVPGVEEASISKDLPLQGVSWGEGMALPGATEGFGIGLKLVDAGYFRTLQIPLEAGRGIEDGDREGTPRVVVINQELARHLSSELGMADPVGRAVDMSVPGYGPIPESRVTAQIIGVIRSERTSGPEAPLERVAYVPLAQVPQQGIKLLVRAANQPGSAMPAIREAVRQIDPNLPLAEVRTMEQVKEQSLLWARQPAWVIGAFAAMAGLLAALGLYGVLAHAVVQQRREIGIRMALGARRREVVSYVLRGALSMLVVGLAAGLAGAMALARVLKSLLFEVSTLDPLALGVACFLMAVVGMLAAWVPANRAARVDPMTVLRDEG